MSTVPPPVPPRRGAILRGRDYRVPPHAPGMRIGLFGGTFDPPHEAHVAASLLALRRLGLDCVWWLVTPGNPLKDTVGLTPLPERIAAARAIAHHPRIVVTGFEAAIGVRYSFDTVRYLVTRCPGAHFVWIMGADNLRHFHRWNRWRAIASMVPIAVIDRLGPSLYASAGAAGHALAFARMNEAKAGRLVTARPPAWLFLHGLKSPLSSTELRAALLRPSARKLAALARDRDTPPEDAQAAPAGCDATPVLADPKIPAEERNVRRGRTGG